MYYVNIYENECMKLQQVVKFYCKNLFLAQIIFFIYKLINNAFVLTVNNKRISDTFCIYRGLKIMFNKKAPYVIKSESIIKIGVSIRNFVGKNGCYFDCL